MRTPASRHFAGHRLGCWINAIPANGLVMIPGGECRLRLPVLDRLDHRAGAARSAPSWTIYSAVGAQTPVNHLAVNLGAPGDRKDALGQIWLSYPRRDAYKQTSLDVRLDLRPKLAAGGAFDSIAETRSPASAGEAPWVYTSWASGLEQLTLPLLGERDKPANYTVRLYFAEGRPDVKEAPVLDVLFNGKQVASKLSLAPPDGQTLRPVVQEIKHVRVERDLVIDLRAEQGKPVLNAIEAIREAAE